MRGATVATTSSRALVNACQRLGLDTLPLLAAAGINPSAIADPDGRLPGENVAALWRLALAQTGDEALPLHAAEGLPFGSYRIVDFLAASAATVGEGLVRVARFFPLVNSTVVLDISAVGAHHHIALSNPRDPTGVPRPYAEYALAVTVLHCRRAANVEWPLVEVRFAYAAPSSTATHERLFGCPVRYGAARSELVIDDASWRLPSAAPSSELLRALEALAEAQVAKIVDRESIATRLVRLLSGELRGGDPSLAHLARRMGMSPRTLQRRLAAEGSSFADALDHTRRLVADCYVKEKGLALTEVAFLLGFSEQSAFSRAFQRWYGCAPSHYRARLSA